MRQEHGIDAAVCAGTWRQRNTHGLGSRVGCRGISEARRARVTRDKAYVFRYTDVCRLRVRAGNRNRGRQPLVRFLFFPSCMCISFPKVC